MGRYTNQRIHSSFLLGLALALLPVHTTADASETDVPLGLEQFAEDTTLDYLSEFSTRRRLTTFFANEQSPFYGVQMNFVNVGKGNFTFLNRDLVRVDRMPIVLGRVYDSSNSTNPDFGPGWKLAVAEEIVQEGDIFTYTDASNSNFQLQEKNGDLVSAYPGITGIDRGTILSVSIEFNLHNEIPNESGSIVNPLNHVNDAHSIIVLTLSSGLTKQFEKIGGSFKLASVSDTEGNFIQHEYSNAGLINKIITRNGGYIAIHRNESGRITAAEDDAGRTVTYHYDTQGRLERYSDLGGGQWVYGYDPQDNLASAVDPRGVVLLNAAYDNEMATEVRILRDRMQFEYAGRNSTRVSNALQQEAVFWQHSSGLTESVQGFSGDMTGFSFDAELKPVSLHFNGVSIAGFSYDGAKLTRFDRTQAGENGTERYVYQHNKLAFIEQNGSEVARYAYDQLGRVAAASDDFGARSYQYHSDGRISSITWDDQRYEIDTNLSGQIEQITANGEQWIGITYNPSGSVAHSDRRFDDTNQPIQFQYDDRGFRTRTNFNGDDIEIAYDEVGNLATMTYPSDQGRALDQYLVGEHNELIQVNHGEKSQVSIEYDVVGRPVNITKGSRILAVGYDQKGRVVDVTLNGSPFVNKHYDAMDSDAVLSSDKRTSFTTVPYPMVSSIFGSIDEIVYTRLRGTAHGPVRFDAQRAGFVLHTAPPVPDIVTLASLERRLLTPLGREFVPAPFKFDKPSSSLFLPPEYASVNCGICAAQTTFLGISSSAPLIAGQTERVYAHVGGGTCEFYGIQQPWEHRVTFGDGSSSTGTGSFASFDYTWNYPGNYMVTDSVSCSCWDPFAIPEEAYMVASVAPPPVPDISSVSVSTQASTSYIDKNIKMPSIQFHATASPDGIPLSDITFHWYLKLKYTANGNNYSHRVPTSGTVDITGKNTWKPGWGGLLAGGNDLTVYVSATANDVTTPVASRGGFAIHGENPTSSQISGYAGSSPWFLTRMIKAESSNRQFAGSIGLPLVNGNGYGLMQVDNPAPSELAKWSWKRNITEGKSSLNSKSGTATSWWTSQKSQWMTYNLENPTTPVAEPGDRTYSGITFSYTPTGSQKPLSDGIWIKLYNGAPVHWLVWKNNLPEGQVPFWQYTEGGNNYVPLVCSQTP